MFLPQKINLEKELYLYELIGVSSLAVISFWKYFDLTSQIIQKKQAIKLVKLRPITKLDQITGHKAGQTVLIQGAVDTYDNSPIIKLVNNRKTYLSLNLHYKQIIYSNQSYSLQKLNYHLKLKEILKGGCLLQVHQHFCLKQKQDYISVKNLDRVDLSNALDLINWENKFRKLTVVEYILVVLASALGSFLNIFTMKHSEHKNIKGIDIGHREVDAGIQIGASLTVLGNVGLTIDGKIFVQPTFVFKDCFSFLVDLSENVDELYFKRKIWIGVMIGSMGYLGWKFYKYGKKNRLF